MDPLGFPFEIYDGLGRLRRADMTNTGGRVDGIETPIVFKDLPGLVDALIEAPEVACCPDATVPGPNGQAPFK